MAEIDWQGWDAAEVASGQPLEGTRIELIRPVTAPSARAVFFDFDGTLSLIRSDWLDVMVPMMTEAILALGTGESRAAIEHLTTQIIVRLTGKQTIYQMIELANQVAKRGGTPLDPFEYKRIFLERLWSRIKDRVTALERGTLAPDDVLVPGSLDVLEALRARGMTIYLASGSDQATVETEADLLGIAPYIDGGMYGAIDDYHNYSKSMVIKRIVAENDLGDAELVGFGDGYTDIEEIKAVSGVAVGVATAEPACRGVDAAKRKRLILAGADVIIPNYAEHERLLAHLFDSPA